MSKVFITDYIDDPYIEKEVLGSLLSDQLHEDIEILLVWHECINQDYLNKLPKLKAVIRYGVGFDSIDLEATKNRNIYVANTPDYGTEEVSDTAIAMIMNIARGVTRYDSQCRDYQVTWQENTLASLKRTSDYMLGVIGAGRIGSSVLLKAKALGMKISFYDPYKPSGYEKMLGSSRFETQDDLLCASDIVSINCPLSAETRCMINESFIKKMKSGSSLVNTARGQLISDIDVFYGPLKSGYLANVAVDVIPEEPPKKSILIDAWRKREVWLDGRFVLNPHTAYYSDKAYFEMRSKAAANALRVIEGMEPLNVVNGL